MLLMLATRGGPQVISKLIVLPRNVDARGALIAMSFASELPFVPARCFLVADSSPGTTRGHHAHKTCHQALICVSGQTLVQLDDGFQKAEYKLESAHHVLHIPPMIWGTQTYLATGTVLLVFASDPYDRSDYLSDYEEFARAARVQRVVHPL